MGGNTRSNKTAQGGGKNEGGVSTCAKDMSISVFPELGTNTGREIFEKYRLYSQPNLPVVSREDIPRLFDVKPFDQGVYRASYHGEETIFGQNVYGGLLFAQGLEAAQQDVGSKFVPSSFHSIFVATNSNQKPIDYHVKHLRDGKSFCSRYVEGKQDQVVVFAGVSNFTKASPPDIQHETPIPAVPPPEQVIDYFEFIEQTLADHKAGLIKLNIHQKMNMERRLMDKESSVLEIRVVTPKRYLLIEPHRNVKAHFWIRCSRKLGDASPSLHRSIACYLSDMYLVGASISPHMSHGVVPAMVTSLDHTIWFHNYDFRGDEWMLYETHGAVADGGRGLAFGKLWTQDGVQIASAAQECLARMTKKSKL